MEIPLNASPTARARPIWRVWPPLWNGIVFLRLNGIEPKTDGSEWEELTLAVVAGAMDRDAATRRLRKLLPKQA